MITKEKMTITFADDADYKYLVINDSAVRNEIIRRKIAQQEIIIATENQNQVGWLRYGYFWDMIPFMNMLHVNEERRRKGIGTKLVEFWETEMKRRGYNKVMTSTLSNEQAQHFYRKLGYRDTGGFILPRETLEILLLKNLM